MGYLKANVEKLVSFPFFSPSVSYGAAVLWVLSRFCLVSSLERSGGKVVPLINQGLQIKTHSMIPHSVILKRDAQWKTSLGTVS